MRNSLILEVPRLYFGKVPERAGYSSFLHRFAGNNRQKGGSVSLLKGREDNGRHGPQESDSAVRQTFYAVRL